MATRSAGNGGDFAKDWATMFVPFVDEGDHPVCSIPDTHVATARVASDAVSKLRLLFMTAGPAS
eukprot:5401422-Alexandrium_andersonii.AAC.1